MGQSSYYEKHEICVVCYLAPNNVKDQGIKYWLKTKGFLLDVLVDNDPKNVGDNVADHMAKE